MQLVFPRQPVLVVRKQDNVSVTKNESQNHTQSDTQPTLIEEPEDGSSSAVALLFPTTLAIEEIVIDNSEGRCIGAQTFYL